MWLSMVVILQHEAEMVGQSALTNGFPKERLDMDLHQYFDVRRIVGWHWREGFAAGVAF